MGFYDDIEEIDRALAEDRHMFENVGREAKTQQNNLMVLKKGDNGVERIESPHEVPVHAVGGSTVGRAVTKVTDKGLVADVFLDQGSLNDSQVIAVGKIESGLFTVMALGLVPRTNVDEAPKATGSVGTGGDVPSPGRLSETGDSPQPQNTPVDPELPDTNTAEEHETPRPQPEGE